MLQIFPSLLSMNLAKIKYECRQLETTDCEALHIDVMDGHFVPNLAMTPALVDVIIKNSTKPLDIHLMVENISFFIDIFASYKPKYLTFHIEAEKHIHRQLLNIKDRGISAGVVVNPLTAVSLLEPIVEYSDIILLMSVNPGFGGQKFIESTYKKVEQLKNIIVKKGYNTLVEVDGGVNSDNAKKLKNSGCDICVAGNYIFKNENLQEAINSLR